MAKLTDFDPELVKEVQAHAEEYNKVNDAIREIIEEAEKDLDRQQEKLLERSASGGASQAVEIYRQAAERIHKEADAKIRMFLSEVKDSDERRSATH